MRKPYVSALAAAESKATQGGKADAVKAILAERETVNAGNVLPGAMRPNLPRDLSSARTTYLRELDKIERASAAKFNQENSAYLRALGALEARAKQGRNQPLLDAIAAQKTLLSSSNAAATVRRGKNVLANPSFEKKGEGWTASGSVEYHTEGEISYAKILQGGPKQSFKLPAGVRQITFSAKVRVRGGKPAPRGFGVVAVAGKAAGKELLNLSVGHPEDVTSTWREYKKTERVPPGVESIVFIFFGFLAACRTFRP